MKSIFCFIVLFGSSVMLFGQNEPLIDIIHVYNERSQSYDFYCENYTSCTYTVEIDFDHISDLTPSQPYPYKRTVTPGRFYMMRLIKTTFEVPGNFQVKLNYRKGLLKQTDLVDIPYLLPFGINKRVLLKSDRSDDEKNSFDYVFETNLGDTVYCSRNGVVTEVLHDSLNSIIDSVKTAVKVSIEVQHIDGTFARYSNFKQNSVNLSVGDDVWAGQQLGIAANNLSNDSTFFNLTVYYFREKIKTRRLSENNTEIVHLPLKFSHKSVPHGEILSKGKSYSVIRDPAIVTKEMTKKEKRKWRRSQSL